MVRRSLVAAAVLVSVLLPAHPRASGERESGGLKAGFSADALPFSSDAELAGYDVRESDGIRDPLTCRALALECGGDELVLIAVDILFLGLRKCDRIRSRISRRSGIPRERILVHSVHTHSAPVPWGFARPGRKVETAIVRNALSAVRRLEPAEMAAGFFSADLGVNDRRGGTGIPSRIGLLRLEGENGKIICSAVNMGCHPVVLGPGNSLMTPDYVHYLRESLESSTGAPILFLSADLGDKNPPPVGYYRDGTFADAEAFGSAAADALAEMLPRTSPVAVDGLSVRTRRIALPLDHAGFERTWRLDEPLLRRIHPDFRMKGRKKISSVTLAAIGNLVLLTSPGESTSGHRKAAADALGLSGHFYLDLTNDYFGYIITEGEWNPSAHEESWGKSAGAAVSRRLVETIAAISR